MAVARLYAMTAAEGKEDAMRDALASLADVVLKIDGCVGVELLQSASDATQFRFIEKWQSADAHGAALAAFPKDAMNPLRAALAKPPEGDYFEYLLVR